MQSKEAELQGLQLLEMRCHLDPSDGRKGQRRGQITGMLRKEECTRFLEPCCGVRE